MQYVHPRDAKTIALGVMSEQLYCLYLHYMNDFQERNYNFSIVYYEEIRENRNYVKSLQFDEFRVWQQKLLH